MSVKGYYDRRHLTSAFGDGRNGGRKHRGVDFSHSTKPNTVDVPAIEGGTVTGKLAPASWHGFGNQVTIKSPSGRIWSYAHLPVSSPLKVGQKISAGTIVGREGRTGSTTGNCVHIELNNGSGFINPAPTIEALRTAGGSSSGGSRGGYQDGSAELGRFQEKLIKMGHDLGPTGADKVFGPKTKAATLHEQKMAEKNGYPGGNVADDGIPGPSTEAYLDWWLVGRHQTAPAPAPQKHNPFGIPSVTGLQKIARLYGYKGDLDDAWGDGSAAGFAQFLRKNHGYSGNDTLGPVMWKAIARWLRGRWGYVGNDVPGPNMRAALKRANDANYREL